MTEHYNLVEARTRFGDLVIAAQAGETSIITRYGKPAAVIAPIGLEAKTVTLDSGGAVTLSMNVNVLSLSPGDREFVFDLIEMVKKYDTSPEEAATKEGQR